MNNFIKEVFEYIREGIKSIVKFIAIAIICILTFYGIVLVLAKFIEDENVSQDKLINQFIENGEIPVYYPDNQYFNDLVKTMAVGETKVLPIESGSVLWNYYHYTNGPEGRDASKVLAKFRNPNTGKVEDLSFPAYTKFKDILISFFIFNKDVTLCSRDEEQSITITRTHMAIFNIHIKYYEPSDKSQEQK